MKKTLLAMLVCVAMLAVVAFPVFAAEPTEWVIPTYTVPTVNDNEVVVDGVMDEAYFKGQKIEGNTDEQRYDRNNGQDGEAISDEVKARSDGSFTTYMLASEKGLYVYAEINDTTMKPGKLDSDSETGDAFQIYLDWVPDEFKHPEPADRGNFQDSAYKSQYAQSAAGQMFMGWLMIDYDNNLKGNFGFANPKSLGVEAAAKVNDANDGWSCELFIPWREEFEGIDVPGGMAGQFKAKKQFNCDIGFQSCDDAYLEGERDFEQNTSIYFDQLAGQGLSYYSTYSVLSHIRFAYDGEDPVPPTSDATIAIVAALVVAGAGLAALTLKKKEN